MTRQSLSRFSLTIILALTVLLPAARSEAQSPHMRFDHLTVEDGLSHGTVFSIVQDRAGFLWFGTPAGLNRYDGYTITVYRSDPQNPASLSNDNAGNLFIDREGILWIGTWGGGLNRLDPATGQFTAYLHDPADPTSLSNDRVQTIFEDRQGNLWVGTAGGGLNKMDRENGTFTVYRHNPADPTSLSNDRIWRIVQAPDDTLWIATSEGLNHFNPQTETFTRYYHDPQNPNSPGHSLIRTLFLDRTGQLWIGTEAGLDRLDLQSETFTHYRHNPADPTSLNDNIINAIYEDRNGNLWIGTRRGGLSLFNRQTEAFTSFEHNPYISNSLSHNDVRWIMEDRSGVLWIGTRGGGVNRLIPTAQQFDFIGYTPNSTGDGLNNSEVRAIYQAPDGILWIGTKGGGLNRYQPVYSRFTYYTAQNAGLTSNDVYAILPAAGGRLWLGLSGGGLNLFDPQAGKVIAAYRHQPDNPNSLSSDDINSLHLDRQGYLWIGTKGGGLNRLDPQTGQFTRYQANLADPHSLGNNDVYGLYEDEAGYLWVCTYGGGLNRLDPQTGQFTRFTFDPNQPASLSNNDVYSIVPDPKDSRILWIGTGNGGLNRLDRTTGEFTRYGEAEGLPSPVVYGILPDRRGNLWLSTGKGLTRFSPSTGQFVTYDSSDGLERVIFVEGAYHQSQDGKLFFGGTNGLIHFLPDDIQDNTVPPPVVITRLTRPGQAAVHFTLADLQRPLVLSYRDDVLTFEFAALDYTNPAKNRYAYMLEGFDRDWVDAGNRRFATYTNLDPGEYTLRVKAANNSGVWNESGVSLKLVIQPPFWETWWFRLAVAGIGIAVGVGIYHLRMRSITAQQERLKRLVAERTAELTAANQSLRLLNERLQHELEIAHRIEQSLLPPSEPGWSHLDVVCFTESAREVGGDFYVYHPAVRTGTAGQQNCKFALAVGDASGKGMPAALLMAVSLASTKSVIEQVDTPVGVLAHLDSAIRPYTHTGLQNCALCYTEVSRCASQKDGWELRAVNAGCIPPLIRRRNGDIEWVDVKGLPLGLNLDVDFQYQEAQVTLQAGDMVILTSDGVVEAMSPERELFGFERLEQSVAGGPADTAAGMIQHLRQSLQAFTGGAEPHDDLTIVVLRVAENP
ncbi:MAG: histidine kinase [Chloroflexi bacterium]|nr:MAG: histidine kinase [Chloroflexota bacterium]